MAEDDQRDGALQGEEADFDDDDDDVSSPADEALTRAQDAFFEGDLTASAAACEEAIALAPTDAGAHSLLATISRQRRDHAATAAACARWGERCGPNAQQMRWLVEALYMAGDKEAAARAAKDMVTLRPRRSEHMSLCNKLSSAAMIADMGLATEAEEILSACVQQEVPDGYEELVTLQVMWVERCRTGERPEGLEALVAQEAQLQSELQAAAASGVGEADAAEELSSTAFLHDVAMLAKSLLAVHDFEAGNIAAARAALPSEGRPEDANLCGVAALIAMREGRREEAEILQDLAIMGANPLLLRRVADALKQ